MTTSVKVVNFGPKPITVETYDTAADHPLVKQQVVYGHGVSDEILVFDTRTFRVLEGEHAQRAEACSDPSQKNG